MLVGPPTALLAGACSPATWLAGACSPAGYPRCEHEATLGSLAPLTTSLSTQEKKQCLPLGAGLVTGEAKSLTGLSGVVFCVRPLTSFPSGVGTHFVQTTHDQSLCLACKRTRRPAPVWVKGCLCSVWTVFHVRLCRPDSPGIYGDFTLSCTLPFQRKLRRSSESSFVSMRTNMVSPSSTACAMRSRAPGHRRHSCSGAR